MENILITCFKIIILILVPFLLKSQDIFNLENSEKYANWLFETKDYKSASEELERVIFLSPNVKTNQLKLIQSYRLSKNYISGINKAKEYYEINNDIVFLEEGLKMNLLGRNFLQVDSLLGLQPFPENKKMYYKYASILLNSNRKQIIQNSILVNNFNLQKETELLETGIQFTLEKHKSPALASIMSAIIPGSGKIYAGDWKNGLMSFLYVAASSFNAYRGFRKHGVNSGYGWIYSSLGFCFYAGNIWGSHKEALRFNKRKKKILEEKVDNIISNN